MCLIQNYSSVLCSGYNDFIVLFELIWCLLQLIYKLSCIKEYGSSVKNYETWSTNVVDGYNL